MKKTPAHLEVIEEASDTGIYRTPPKRLFRRKTGTAAHAYGQRQADLFDFDSLLVTAEQFADKILADARVQDGSAYNWERRREYALQLSSYVHLVREARKKGDWEKAAVYALWVGRFWEASRVLRVEHNAKKMRDRKDLGRAWGKKRAILAETVAAWNKRANELRQETLGISEVSVAQIIANETGGSAETIRKKITRSR